VRPTRFAERKTRKLLGKAVALAIGVGIGVGLLIAPASGEDTRADIAGKISNFGENVKRRERGQPPGVTASNRNAGIYAQSEKVGLSARKRGQSCGGGTRGKRRQ